MTTCASTEIYAVYRENKKRRMERDKEQRGRRKNPFMYLEKSETDERKRTYNCFLHIPSLLFNHRGRLVQELLLIVLQYHLDDPEGKERSKERVKKRKKDKTIKARGRVKVSSLLLSLGFALSIGISSSRRKRRKGLTRKMSFQARRGVYEHARRRRAEETEAERLRKNREEKQNETLPLPLSSSRSPRLSVSMQW